MSRTRRFLRHGLLHIISLLGFVISIVLAPIIVLFGKARELIYDICSMNEIWERDFPYIINGSLSFFYLQIAIAIPGLSVEYFGKEHLFDAIVVAGFVLVFVAFQYPRMLPPYFGVHFLPLKRHSLSVKSGVKTDLYLGITNLGLTVFKNCLCNVCFEENFKVIDNPNYKVSYNHDAIFTPDKIFLTVSPCSHLILGIQVQTPTKPGNYKVRVLLDSETAWGTAEQSLNVHVSTNK